ncbi:MAG TPA: PAS domain S-box protein [Pyrinomonadaceae bacterium]|jgi:PAS domain S-box-containing protein
MPQVTRSIAMRYGIALLSVVLAVILTMPLGQLASRMPFALFFAAVMLSAWYGGAGPGLLATALSLILSAYFFVPPQYSLNIGLYGAVQLGVFLMVALFINLLTAARMRAQENLHKSEQWLTTTLRSIGDAVIATDARGSVTFMNEAAQAVTGWTQDEAIGRDLKEVFRIINEGSRQEVESPVEKVIREGTVVGLANHTLLIRKDGREVPIDDSGAPIRDESGEMAGVVLVFRDISERKEADAARLRLATIVDSSGDAIIGKTLEGIITSWNAGAERIYGYTASEVVGRSVTILAPPELGDEVPHILETIRKGEGFRNLETVRQRKDGTRINVSLSISPIRDHAGHILGASTIARDVTARRRMEKALRASEERYRAFVAQSAEAIWRCELDEPISVDLSEDEQIERFYRDGYLAECNDVMAEMYGYEKAEEIIGARLGDLLDRSEPGNEAFLRAFIRSGYRLEDAESAEFNKEGEHKYFFNNLVGIIEDRALLRVWGTQRDVTARKQAEAELQASEQRYRSLADAMPQIVWTARADGYTDYYNRRWYEYTGMTPEQTEGWGWQPVLHPEDVEKSLRAWATAVQTGKIYEIEYRFRRGSDGAYRWHLARGVPMRDKHGQILKWFGTATDIDDQKRAAEERLRLLAHAEEARLRAEEANRTKDEFLATLSHELRTPLTAMLGWTRMLRTKELDETTSAHALATIERNIYAQTQLIEDLLDVSRIITGKLRLDVSPVELMPIIEAALDSVRPAAEAKEILLQTALDPLTGPVSGDAARLQQVVWNLVSNAVKFTPKGGRINVRLERVESHVEINVSDSGQGISTEFLPHVFDRFRQADSSTTRVHGGLGLGLAIVRHLVELHGGTVHAESQGTGQGSTFKVKLPVAPVRKLDAGLIEGEARDAASALDCLTALDDLYVLVVDDEHDARELLVTVLEKCGATVQAVENVSQALDTIRERRPDILISDIGMPGEDGYDLIRQVRSMPDEQGASLPALALTAYAGEDNRQQALEAGFQMHLSKPIDPHALSAAIASLVRQTNKV